MPKVSVIIPIYKVEKYIERCARSLFEQTLDEIEYIFIDDCTPDKSMEILKQVIADYPHRKKQTVIYRMPKNSGQAAVRKWGMQNAKGDYVIHCDSDDWVDNDMYRAMYDEAIKEGADIVICDFYLFNGVKYCQECGCYNVEKQVFFKNLLLQKEHCALWNKLIKRSSCCKDLIWPEGNMGEDMLLCLQFVYNSVRIAHITSPLYYYFLNPCSISGDMSVEAILNRYNQSIKNAECLSHFLCEKNIYHQYQDDLDFMLLQKKNLLRPLIGKPEYYKMWLDTFPWLNRSIFFNRDVSASQKVKHLLTILRLYRK